MRKYLNIPFIICGLMLSIMSYGQEDWENNTGEIEDVEVQIIKDREIKLLKANRNFEKINPTFAATVLPKFNYEFQEFNFEIPDLIFKLRPLRIKTEQLQKLYGGYLKAGFGNFGTPYLEGYVNNKRDKQYAYGAHVKHLSSKNGPVDEENSGVSESQFDVFGKVFTKKAVLGGDLGFGLNKVHFYGYPTGDVVNADDIEQQFTKLKVNGFVKSNNGVKDPSYLFGLGYKHISDDFNAKEGVFSSKFTLIYPASGDNSFGIDANLSVISRTDTNVSDSRLLFNAQPTYDFNYNNFKLTAGLNAVYENDTLQSLGKLHLYPVIRAAYDVSTKVELYAGLEGGIVSNTYHSTVARVPFVNADAPISHTNKLYQFSGGLRAKAGKSSFVHAGFSMGGYKEYQYVVNNSTDASRFNLFYDSETSTIANIFGEWGMTKSQQLQWSLRGDYFMYNMGSQAEAWHQPQYKVTAMAKYNIFNKIILEADLHVLGGLKALDLSADMAIDLDPVIDLGVQGKYLLSEQFSIFVKLNNVMSQENQLLYRYPMKGFQAIGGISYTF
jgi:hypothetical protein